MDRTAVAKACNLGDKHTSDVTLCLRNSEGRPEWFYFHSSILISRFFADQLSNPESCRCIKIQCSVSTTLLDFLDSVKSAISIPQLAVAFHSEDITNCSIQYIFGCYSREGRGKNHIAMPILGRIQPVDVTATKNMFVSAVRFATSIGGSFPTFGDELKTSAKEQVEFMLGGDEDTLLVKADGEVKSVVKTGLSQICSSFERELFSLIVLPDITTETAEKRILLILSDVEWMSDILPKMDLMKEFVSSWVEISVKVLEVAEDNKLNNIMWGLKVKLIEVTRKVLEAVSYGNVILPAPSRVQLLKTWLPYIRKIKPLLDAKGGNETDFPYKIDKDLWQSIEGATVSLLLALPSNNQADIFSDWMNTEQVRYPDLSEAFEVWCYRTKSAKRRLLEGLDRVGNTTVSL